MFSFSTATSKLPEGKDSIFSTMSRLARENEAIDLSQGFPNFRTDDRLKELVYSAMKQGYNQYAPPAGIPQLREEIVKKIHRLHGREYDVEKEVSITNGATQALFLAITAFVRKGDEVIVLKPAYDSYEPAIALQGGIPVPVMLEGKEYEVNWDAVKEKISPKTRMIIINTPHNPSGRVWSRKDLEHLEHILRNTDILVLSDEVYEHLTFDGHQHHSASSLPGLAERSIVCASFGKTFHNTGWKMGYCVAPGVLMAEMRKVHQVNVFCVNHPMQRAYAEYLKQPEHYLELGEFYQHKRDYFLELIRGSRFKGKPTQGTYFQILDYSEITDEGDVAFAERLIRDYKLASIPVSVFNYKNKDHRQLRFCFAKTEETLERAAEIMHRIR